MKGVGNVQSADGRRAEASYPIAEAARYLRLPAATLRSWTIGRHYPKGGGRERFRPLIKAAYQAPPLLSFWNLVEAHVLRALRTEHGIAIKELRRAISFAERDLGLERLLLHRDLSTHAGQVFVEHYGRLINLSASGQLAMRRLLDEHLKRVEWSDSRFPIRLYPFVSAAAMSGRPVAIDPQIAFGRPVILRTGISTGVIAGRLDAGESVADVASDYDMSHDEIEQAALYERAA